MFEFLLLHRSVNLIVLLPHTTEFSLTDYVIALLYIEDQSDFRSIVG